METFSAGALLVLGMIVFLNVRDGTLGDWFHAKFLGIGKGQAAATNRGASLVALLRPPASTSSGQVTTPGVTGGALAVPLAGSGISQPFGGAHAGVDLTFPGALGAPVRAAGTGTVTFAGASGDYGLRVDIDHGAGLLTRYAHLQRIDVNTGAHVTTGQQIGTVGQTGHATGPHLHFEVRLNGTPENPCTYGACPVGVVA